MSKPMAIIYQPAKTAMQSGHQREEQWLLRYQTEDERWIEPMMGWTASADMEVSELCLSFPSKEAAESYAKKQNIAYEILTHQQRQIRPKSYAENFL